MERTISDFWRGVIAGVIACAIIFGIGVCLAHLNKRDKELDEFFEIPDVRRAADGAAAEFDRKRDEALQRFRSGYFDR